MAGLSLLAMAVGGAAYLVTSAKLTKHAIQKDRKKTAAMLDPLSVDWTFWWEETTREPWLTAGEIASLGLVLWGSYTWPASSPRTSKIRNLAIVGVVGLWSLHLRSWAKAPEVL